MSGTTGRPLIVDSHCHLDFDSFDDDRDDVIERARRAGVCRMITIGTKISRFDRVLAVAERYEDVFCSVGVHPHEADREGLPGPGPLLERAVHSKVVGIGESGLDYHYRNASEAGQKASFRAHIEAAHESGLPLIIHNRDSDSDMADMLEAAFADGIRPSGVLHCFTGSADLAHRAVAIGFHVSIAGIITFKNAKALRETVAAIPVDRLLVETDSPFLAPVPMRGKRNEPAYVQYTHATLAELKGMDAGRLARQTTENFFRLFAKVPRPAEFGEEQAAC